MNRNIAIIVDVWREYVSGISGGPSVKQLEEQHGTAWRKERKELRFFSRKKNYTIW